MKWLILALGISIALLVVSLTYDVGMPKPMLAVVFSEDHFPEVGVGGYSTLEFTVINLQKDSIAGSVTEVYFPFICMEGCSFTLAPQENVTVIIEFRPVRTGQFKQVIGFNAGGREITSVTVFATVLSSNKQPWEYHPQDPERAPRKL